MRRKQILDSIPQRLKHVVALSCKLEPSDAFLLAQVDGASTVEQLCDITPLSQDEVVIRVLRLEHLGLVKLRGTESHAGDTARVPRTSQRPSNPPSPAALGADRRKRREALGRWRRGMVEE